MKRAPGKSQAKGYFCSQMLRVRDGGAREQREGPMPRDARDGERGKNKMHRLGAQADPGGVEGFPLDPLPVCRSPPPAWQRWARPGPLPASPESWGARRPPCQKYALQTAAESNFHAVLCLPPKIKPHPPTYLHRETPAEKLHRETAPAPFGCHSKRGTEPISVVGGDGGVPAAPSHLPTYFVPRAWDIFHPLPQFPHLRSHLLQAVVTGGSPWRSARD